MLANGVKETTVTAGTGTLTLSAVTGSVRFSDAFPAGLVVPYHLKDGSNHEWGIGKVAAANTLERTSIRATYAAGVYDNTAPAAITLSGGTVDVELADMADLRANSMPNIDTVSSGLTRYHFSRHMSFVPASDVRASAIDRCQYIAFYLETPCVATHVGFRVATAVAASTAKCAIYNVAPNGYIGDKIVESTAADDTSTTGYKESAIANTYLSPGWYYLAVATTHAVVLNAYSAGQAGTNRLTPLGYDTSLRPIGGRYETLTAGWTSLPSTPNAVTSAMDMVSDFCTALHLKVA